MKVHPTPALPASLPRDLTLHAMRKDKRLYEALVKAPQPRWIRASNQVRVTLYFDMEKL